MNNAILTDNKEIETFDLPSWWSDDFPCVATLIKTGVKGIVKGVNWFIDRFIYGRSQGRLPGVA